MCEWWLKQALPEDKRSAWSHSASRPIVWFKISKPNACLFFCETIDLGQNPSLTHMTLSHTTSRRLQRFSNRTLPPTEVRMTFFSCSKDTASFNSSTEFSEYLKLGSKLETLIRFPTAETIFLKFNTPTLCSVHVEQLFSLGSLVLSSRNRFNYKWYKRLFLVKYNYCFSDKHVYLSTSHGFLSKRLERAFS